LDGKIRRITIVSIGAPTGFVGVFDRSASILQEQSLWHRGQAPGQLMQGGPQATLGGRVASYGDTLLGSQPHSFVRAPPAPLLRLPDLQQPAE
jgi:hypothetical protein